MTTPTPDVPGTELPCPFCGGCAADFTATDGLYYVQCEDCFAQTNRNGEETAEQAITQWNQRVPDTTLAAENVALREALEVLEVQALQSPDLLRTEWGQDALALTRSALLARPAK
jgi:Lar family restriction alleviation protein